jgi:hypothetical protein
MLRLALESDARFLNSGVRGQLRLFDTELEAELKRRIECKAESRDTL